MKEATVPATTEQEAIQDTRETARTLMPPVDIFEVEDGLAVVADLPGVAKEGIDIQVDNDILTVKGSVHHEPHGEPLHREYHLADYAYFRQFQLSEHVDRDNIRAEMKHGVLTIHLPKAEKSRPKKIDVAVS